MSYDIDIGCKSFNYTSNVSRLFYDHIPATGSCRGGLHALHGLTGKQAQPILSEAFERIHDTHMQLWDGHAVGEPEFCERYDPANGWGSAVGGLIFLARIMAACAQCPRCKVRVDA